MKPAGLLVRLLSLLVGCSITFRCAVADMDVNFGQWWKEYLSSEIGNSWFDPWNHVMQAKFDQLAEIAEAREDKTDPFRVMMVGDSTMQHQFGTVCGFLGEREGRRFDPKESQRGSSSGCCIDTLEGGGAGLCFNFDWFRFLNPRGAGHQRVDAYYFGSGLHLLHMVSAWPGSKPMEPLRVQEWLHYESLLEGTVEAVRESNGQDVRIAFMTNHAVADEKYLGDFAMIRDAYRVGDGNSTIRDLCEEQIGAAATGDFDDFKYYDWGGPKEIEDYFSEPEGEFTVETYCEQALMDRQGSLQLSRRARPVMARLGVPLVDATRIVDGQSWASKVSDGRHYHPIVPLEVFALLEALIAPPPPPNLSAIAAREAGGDESGDAGPRLRNIAVESDEP